MERTEQEVVRIESRDARVEVVGTQSYQDAIWRIVGPPTAGPGGRAHWQGEATLGPEPENCYDCNAVRVAIGDATIGYLPRDLAARLQPALTTLAQHGKLVAVPCYAIGGFTFRDGTLASVGLRLRFDPRDVIAAAQRVETERAA